MRNLLKIVALGVAVGLAGCAGSATSLKDAPITKTTTIRCPKCGAVFSVEEGLDAKSR